jgi:ParB-like chromosome segregation protein Spo0J
VLQPILVRENLTAIEEAEAVERLRAIYDYAHSNLATDLSKPDSTLTDIL